MKSIDLFAGIGGNAEGARLAGVENIWSGDHWDLACEYHRINHPNAIVVQQDLQQADWREVPAHDIMLASPPCQGHSKARGTEKPHHNALRSTAWAVVACAEYHRESVLVIENVVEFVQWSLYPIWCDALERLGYAISPHVINAADHGVPQERVRVFIVCTRTKAPLRLRLPKRMHRPANDIIEWDAHSWTPINKPGRAQATLDRIANGRRKYGDRFVAPFYGSGSGNTGRSIHRPLGTVTTLDRWAVIDGDRMRVLQPSENRAAMGFGRHIQLPKVKRMANFLLGNAVAPPVVRDILLSIKEQA